MNNEPVAWMLLGLEDRKPKLINLQVIEHLEGTWIPLYTNPADLTDEEIIKTGLEIGIVSDEELTEEYAQDYVEDVVKFARAILRKAGEK